jgi:hypothetical protein
MEIRGCRNIPAMQELLKELSFRVGKGIGHFRFLKQLHSHSVFARRQIGATQRAMPAKHPSTGSDFTY